MKKREEVSQKECWNVESLYPNMKCWEQALADFIPNPNTSPLWPQLASYQGTLAQGPSQILNVLQLLLKIDRELTKLYTYAHLRHDEEISNPIHKTAYEQIGLIAHAFAQESAWIQPELLSLNDIQLQEALFAPSLEDYRFLLEKMVRLKKHTLTADQEKLIALAGQALQSPYKAFNAISDADFIFDSVRDSQNQELPLTHASYSLYLRSQDRTLREHAFKTYHGKYKGYENTLCELLNGQMQKHLFDAKSRNYTSCLEAALFPKNIPSSVYSSLILAVNQGIGALHRYMELRKRLMSVETLHLYDLYVPLIKDMDKRIPYAEAEELVIQSTAPLGKEYQNALREGLYHQHWVDKYENQHKRSGAYSSGCYDSMPYILMNYKELLRDLFTLAHEAGHSMHSLYSRRAQPYQYSDYPIFLAEVASTFNEKLLARYLLERASTKGEKIFLINQLLEDIRGTLFRQTMFAEFELLLHQHVELGVPLTPTLLKKEYLALNAKYFGPTVFIDQEIDIEWARIPHFYYDFYVFQYATGISAALALEKRVSAGDTEAQRSYLKFLSAGSSDYPIALLQQAGIDMESSAPVLDAISTFSSLLDEMDLALQDSCC